MRTSEFGIQSLQSMYLRTQLPGVPTPALAKSKLVKRAGNVNRLAGRSVGWAGSVGELDSCALTKVSAH